MYEKTGYVRYLMHPHTTYLKMPDLEGPSESVKILLGLIQIDRSVICIITVVFFGRARNWRK